MTAEERAIDLYRMYYESLWYQDEQSRMLNAKESALIAVQFAREFITGDLNEAFDKFIYLQDIKEQIENL